MADEEVVKLSLIFPNEEHRPEMSVPVSHTVRELKRTIMQHHWPQSVVATDGVERIRLLSGGKELGGKDADDSKQLKDAKLSLTTRVPVHVVIAMKSTTEQASEKDTTKPHQCLCMVL